MTKQIVENDIVILSEREQIRNKISVWHGSSLNHNANIKELIGNSQDEILKGNGSKIKITMLNDNLIIFEDNCQGLPVEGTTINSKGDKIDNYIALFEMTFAGTKYNAFENEEYSVGTNGVFLATLSASSKHIKYEISRPKN
jgi:DNA gyrase subunit B